MNNEQLYKKQNGNYKEVYPNTLLSSILDKESGKSLKDIIKAYNHLYVPFINNIYETLTAIPVYIRRKGLWVTWEIEDGIKTYQFELSTAEAANDAIWGNIESWTQVPDLDYYEHHAAVPDGSITLDKLSEELRDWLVNAGKIVNNPDNESISEEHGILKIANRNYNSDINSMGYIILRKDKTFAEQVVEENTIYEIKYDFILDANVTIPNNCVLKFEGGSINGVYTLIGSHTGINASLVKIFNTDISLGGSWNIAEAYPEWFGAKGNQIANDTLAIQKTLNYFDIIKFTSDIGYAIYADNEGICLRLPLGKTIISTKRKPTSYEPDHVTLYVHGTEFIGILCEGLNTIENISIRGVDVTGFDQQRVYTSVGIKLLNRNNFVKNVDVTNIHIGIETFCFETTLIGCVIMVSKTGFYCHGSTDNKWYENDAAVNYDETSLTLINCYVMGATTEGYVFQGITYSSLISCAADGCGLLFNEAAVTSEDNIYYPYHFLRCTAISVISCGAEICGKYFRLYRCAGMSIENCNCALQFRAQHEENIEVRIVIRLDYNTGIILKNIIIQKADNIRVHEQLCITEDSYITVLFTPGMGGTLGGNLFVHKVNIGNWGTATNNITIIPTWKMYGSVANIPDPYKVGEGNIYMDTDNNKPLFMVNNKWVYADGTELSI